MRVRRREETVACLGRVSQCSALKFERASYTFSLFRSIRLMVQIAGKRTRDTISISSPLDRRTEGKQVVSFLIYFRCTIKPLRCQCAITGLDQETALRSTLASGFSKMIIRFQNPTSVYMLPLILLMETFFVCCKRYVVSDLALWLQHGL